MEAVTAAAIGVEDLDDSALLAAASDAERRDREVQLDKLRIAYEWCVRHPATVESGAATWGDSGLPGVGDCDASLGGDGSPAVAPFVAEELGAALGVSTQSAMALMADALDLRHRLPLGPLRRRPVDRRAARRTDRRVRPAHPRAAGGPGRGRVRAR